MKGQIAYNFIDESSPRLNVSVDNGPEQLGYQDEAFHQRKLAELIVSKVF